MTETPIAVPTADGLMSTPVVAVTTQHSLAAAWEAMRQRQVHHIAVMDDQGLAAVLDDRRVAAEWPAGGPDAARRRCVGDIVRRGVRCVLPEAPATAVARVMIEDGCDAVPVVTTNGALVGLVTSTDLVAAIAAGSLATGPLPPRAVEVDERG